MHVSVSHAALDRSRFLLRSRRFCLSSQVKSRMQNQLRVEGQPLKYNLAIPSLITVLSEEGAQALYK